MDKYIRVKNCNCISDATIEIVEKSLNIKYGSNGTGKSTISEAIYAQANNETDRLKDFKPYGSNDNSQPTVDNPYFHVCYARLAEKEHRMNEIMESMPIPLFDNASDDLGDEDIKALIKDYVRRTKKN